MKALLLGIRATNDFAKMKHATCGMWVLSGKEFPCAAGVPTKKHLFANRPFRLVAYLVAVIRARGLLHREFVQTDILHGGPNYGQATGFCREHINLIGALSHIAEETFDRIGGLNMPMHGGRELVKRQEMLFILSQASHRFWIALALWDDTDDLCLGIPNFPLLIVSTEKTSMGLLIVEMFLGRVFEI